MGFRLIQPGRVKKVKSHNAQEVLDRLEAFLTGNTKEPVRVLCGFWEDQQNAISYQELRQAVLDGYISEQTMRDWQHDYSVLVKNELAPMWQSAMMAGPSGQPIFDGKDFEMNMQTPGVLNWINERGAEFVTASTIEQREAIAALLEKKIRDEHTVDELAKMIRPCIGLTGGQARANAKFYDNIVKTLTEEHPRMSKESIRKKALDASTKYAERQHRQRALTIAQTESAFAYNRGADEGVRQAMSAGLLGLCEKVWSTSGDENVCATCNSLEGTVIGMDDSFGFKGRELFTGHKMLPPAHPMCACAIEYREIEAPRNIPAFEVNPFTEDDTRKYTDEEIKDFADKTESMISKYTGKESKWSGNIVVVHNEVHENYQKLPNCDILTSENTAPYIIMHEQLHARSISYCSPIVYNVWQSMEEATVEFAAGEISAAEGVTIIESQYTEIREALRIICRRIDSNISDMDWSMRMLEMDVEKRWGWLSNKVFEVLGDDAIIEEYREYAALLDKLFGGI